jgi:hypothetical protein
LVDSAEAVETLIWDAVTIVVKAVTDLFYGLSGSAGSPAAAHATFHASAALCFAFPDEFFVSRPIAVVVDAVACFGRHQPTCITYVSLIFIDLTVAVVVFKVTNLFFGCRGIAFFNLAFDANAAARAALAFTRIKALVNSVITVVINSITLFDCADNTRAVDYNSLVTHNPLSAHTAVF